MTSFHLAFFTVRVRRPVLLLVLTLLLPALPAVSALPDSYEAAYRCVVNGMKFPRGREYGLKHGFEDLRPFRTHPELVAAADRVVAAIGKDDWPDYPENVDAGKGCGLAKAPNASLRGSWTGGFKRRAAPLL